MVIVESRFEIVSQQSQCISTFRVVELSHGSVHRSTMDEAQKRVFSVAFGVINNALNKQRQQEKLWEEADDEFMLIVCQFTAM